MKYYIMFYNISCTQVDNLQKQLNLQATKYKVLYV